jgi:ankyrin repeat protein
MEAEFAGAGLFMAAQNNELESVASQLAKGADVNGTMQDGLTPLFMAVANKRMEMATLLLDKGATAGLEKLYPYA